MYSASRKMVERISGIPPNEGSPCCRSEGRVVDKRVERRVGLDAFRSVAGCTVLREKWLNGFLEFRPTRGRLAADLRDASSINASSGASDSTPFAPWQDVQCFAKNG